ncbi:MAG TPA: hypothetical protein VIE65_07530 [Methylobacter sp.]|jgi:hypothetical protein
MRLGFVRSDISANSSNGRLYLQDVENSSQRNFSSEPKGQSRYFRKPTDTELTALLNTYAFVTIQGSNTAATVDTTVANGTKLNIRTSASATFTQITVTSNAAVTKAQLIIDLNAGFKAAGLGLTARIAGTNQVTIDTTAIGPNAYVEISAGSPSAGTFQTVVGLAVAATPGVTLANLKSAIYPTATTINVSTAGIAATTGATFSLMTNAAETALVSAIADKVAPRLVETGAVLLSFAYGVISKLRSTTFQPGGTRIGLPAGIAAACVQDDGSTVFTL